LKSKSKSVAAPAVTILWDLPHMGVIIYVCGNISFYGKHKKDKLQILVR